MLQPVHPHVRGADGMVIYVPKLDSGSPPRAWGRPRLEAGEVEGPRFTPTCVGQTCCPLEVVANPSVHPHVRGADTFLHYIRIVFPFLFQFQPFP